MARRMLNNPVHGEGSSVREVFIVSPDLTAKIASLETQLAAELAKPPVVATKEITVEKEVLRDDPGLLLKYNAAMKELGDIKRQANREQPRVLQLEPKTEQAEITKEVVRLVYVKIMDKQHAIIAIVCGVLLGLATRLF